MKEGKKEVLIEMKPFNEGMVKEKIEKAEDINELAKNKLILVCLICFFFMAIEFVGGIWASSLAIMTDAAHLLSDLAGFVISIFALQYAKKAPNSIFTFGYYRAEIVGAFFSVMIIWILTIILLCESIQRLFDIHHHIDGKIMLISASIGLVFNLIMVYILHSDGNMHSHCEHLHHHDHHHDHKHHENQNRKMSNCSHHHNGNLLDHKIHENLHKHSCGNHTRLIDSNGHNPSFEDTHNQFKENFFHEKEKKRCNHSNNHHTIQSQKNLTRINFAPQVSKVIELNNMKVEENDFSFKSSTILKNNENINRQIVTPKHVTSNFNVFKDNTPVMERKLTHKIPDFYLQNFNLMSCNEKDSVNISINKKLINIRKKSSGSVLQNIIELHSNNMEKLRKNYLNKDNLLHSPKSSKKSLESNNNVNIKAAMIHIIGDIIQSVGVIIASILIYFFPSYHILDPLITIMFSVIVVFTTIPIVKECIITIMEAKPDDFNYNELKKTVNSIQGVKEIKCIHIFCLSTDKLVIQLKVVSDEEDVLSPIREAVLKEFDCYHLNVEVQKSNIDYYENQGYMNV